MPEETEAYLSRPLLRLEVAFANARRPRRTEERMVSYGRDDQQRLLMFVPDSQKALGKLIVYIHGVGWNGGNPRGARFVGRLLAEEGFTVAVCGYRPSPQAIFPAQLEDVYSALAAALEINREQGGDERFILAGFGSGAHLATLVALDERQQARHCLPNDRIAGVLALSGIVDFSLCRDEEACRDLTRLMGGRRGWDAADPIRHATGTERTPMLLVHGAKDRIVPADAARAFGMKINAGREDGPVQLLVVPGSDHEDILRLFIEHRPETPVVLDWLHRRASEPPITEAAALCLVGEGKGRKQSKKKSSARRQREQGVSRG